MEARVLIPSNKLGKEYLCFTKRYLALTEFFITKENFIKKSNFENFKELLEDLVNPKNAVSKGERVFLQFAYTTNIFIFLGSLVENGEFEDEKSQKIVEILIKDLKDNLNRNSEYVYFTAANLNRLITVIEETEGNEDSDFLKKKREAYKKLFEILLKELLKIPISLDNFKNAYYDNSKNVLQIKLNNDFSDWKPESEKEFKAILTLIFLKQVLKYKTDKILFNSLTGENKKYLSEIT